MIAQLNALRFPTKLLVDYWVANCQPQNIQDRKHNVWILQKGSCEQKNINIFFKVIHQELDVYYTFWPVGGLPQHGDLLEAWRRF